MKRRWPRFAAFGIAACCSIVLMINTASATINVITIGDPVIPIDRDLVTYTSSYPANESPFKAIDNLNVAPTGTKYTNFGRFNAGFTILPSIGPTVIKSFEIDTANDNEPRDPATYELYGSNDVALSSLDNSDGSSENWTLISSGALSLPAGRRTLGPVVPVANTTAYNLYRLVFPTLKTPNAATVMQIGEVSFFQNTDGSGGDFINEFDDIRAIKIPTPAVSGSISPLAQPADAGIDGNVNSKYLNFGINNTGMIVTPSRGATAVNGFQITTANDQAPRDPTSYEVWGTNNPITSGVHSTGEAETWTLVSSGPLTPPAGRLTPYAPVSFANTTNYASYKVIFPTIVGPIQTVPGGPGITSMQIADIQLFADGTDTPGDYNGDGLVNPADYTIWQKQFGFAGVGINADGNKDGVVSAADYVLWRNNAAAGSGAVFGSAVPEPSSCLLVVLGLMSTLGCWRRR